MSAPSEATPSLGWWVTGLTDGEGCFYAGMVFRTKSSARKGAVSCVELDARFQIALRRDDMDTLKKVQTYFGNEGTLRVKRRHDSSPSRLRHGHRTNHPQAELSIRDPKVLLERVIPHFETFPLQSKKSSDFDQWRKIVEFAVSELVGHKGWLRRYPDKVSHLNQMCSDLRVGRAFVPSTHGGN